MKTNLNIEELQNDFEYYITKFDEIRGLATRFKTTPTKIVDTFFGIGLEALKHTETILKKEFESKLEDVYKNIRKEKSRKMVTLDESPNE